MASTLWFGGYYPVLAQFRHFGLIARPKELKPVNFSDYTEITRRRYEYALGINGRWLINAVTLKLFWQRGNREIMELAVAG
ncbi:MAG: hypothetical protein OXU70_13440 [Gammaproteobacteria bacterium]|nr:hypothetical protein [Gammaproteobacteria bacterium]